MNLMSDCPKCKGRMEEGFIVDNTHQGKAVSEWASGQPKPSIWFLGGLDVKKSLEVTTYRCTLCGYLESYAK